MQSLASIGAWEYDFDGGAWSGPRRSYRLLDAPDDTAARLDGHARVFGQGAGRLQAAVAALRSGGDGLDLELDIATAATAQSCWVRVIGEPLDDRRHARRHHRHHPGRDPAPASRRKRLRLQALSDPLTGLVNRDALLRALARAIAEAPPAPAPRCCASTSTASR